MLCVLVRLSGRQGHTDNEEYLVCLYEQLGAVQLMVWEWDQDTAMNIFSVFLGGACWGLMRISLLPQWLGGMNVPNLIAMYCSMWETDQHCRPYFLSLFSFLFFYIYQWGCREYARKSFKGCKHAHKALFGRTAILVPREIWPRDRYFHRGCYLIIFLSKIPKLKQLLETCLK